MVAGGKGDGVEAEAAEKHGDGVRSWLQNKNKT